MTLLQLATLLRNHDWWYDKSDDMSVYYKGVSQRWAICAAAKEFCRADLILLLNEFCPDELRAEWNKLLLKDKS